MHCVDVTTAEYFMRCVDVMIMLLRKGIVRNDETQTQNIYF